MHYLCWHHKIFLLQTARSVFRQIYEATFVFFCCVDESLFWFLEYDRPMFQIFFREDYCFPLRSLIKRFYIKCDLFVNLLSYQEGHPSPGKPFQGGIFEAFFPDCDDTRRLLPRLEKAFRKGLTFTVRKRGTGAEVIWDGIPHKTTLQGGRSGWVLPY